MKKKLPTFICLLFIFSIVMTIIDFACFYRPFYDYEYKKTNTAERIGVSDEDLGKLTDVVLEFLKHKDNTMDIQLEVNGKVQEVFSDRAKLHMIDVRNLYFGMNAIETLSFSTCIILFMYVVVSKKYTFEDFFESYKVALIIFGAIFAFIGLFALIDFNTFWTSFHKIFFTNDLWLLSYNDVLVNMVNSTFFFDLVLIIVGIIVLFLGLVYFLMRKYKYAN